MARIPVALMGLAATSLVVISALHLGHVLTGKKPFRATDAGIAEAVICAVLVYGIVALLRRSTHGRGVALAAVAFAIVGFVVGLTFTVRGGDTIDIAYHAAVLPLLLVTLLVLLRPPRSDQQHRLSISAGLEGERRR